MDGDARLAPCRPGMTLRFPRGLLRRVVRPFCGYDVAHVDYDTVMANDEWMKSVYLNPCCVVCGEGCAYGDLIFYSFGLEIVDLVIVFELYRFLPNDMLCDEIFKQGP